MKKNRDSSPLKRGKVNEDGLTNDEPIAGEEVKSVKKSVEKSKKKN